MGQEIARRMDFAVRMAGIGYANNVLTTLGKCYLGEGWTDSGDGFQRPRGYTGPVLSSETPSPCLLRNMVV